VKKKLLWIALICLGLLLCAFVLWPRDPITPETCARIMPGMREKEVEAFLDGRPGKEPGFQSIIRRGEYSKWWAGENGTIVVTFTEPLTVNNNPIPEKVIRARYYSERNQNLLQRLRQSFGW
jgi:hypothetical protein